MFHPQDIVCQMKWVSAWFDNLRAVLRSYRVGQAYAASAPVFVVTDRSPYSAAVYAHVSDEADRVALRETICGLVRRHEALGIHFHVLCLTREKGEVSRDVLKRVGREPERKAFDEHRTEHFERVWGIYQDWEVFANKGVVPTPGAFDAYVETRL